MKALLRILLRLIVRKKPRRTPMLRIYMAELNGRRSRLTKRR